MHQYVAFSGGIDSTAALYAAIQTEGPEKVRAVSFSYGQRHAKELDCARKIARTLHVQHTILDLGGLLHGSALLNFDQPVPHGHYAAATMESTVVNGRNLLFAAALIAGTEPGDTVVLGVHSGDRDVYADCRPDFIHAVTQAARAYEVSVSSPWLNLSKAAILCTIPDAPYELTWSCYTGASLHCGRCGTCVERAEAFHLAGLPDPTTYTDPDYWRQVTNP